MIRDQGIKEGHWMLTLEFGLVGTYAGPNAEDIFPSAIIPVQKFGITRLESPTPISVDASKIKKPAKNRLERVAPAKAKTAKTGIKRTQVTTKKKSKI